MHDNAVSAEALLRHRQLANVSQSWLARKLKTTVMEIDALEQGRVALTEPRMDAIANILKILPAHLYNGCMCGKF